MDVNIKFNSFNQPIISYSIHFIIFIHSILTNIHFLFFNQNPSIYNSSSSIQYISIILIHILAFSLQLYFQFYFYLLFSFFIIKSIINSEKQEYTIEFTTRFYSIKSTTLSSMRFRRDASFPQIGKS